MERTDHKTQQKIKPAIEDRERTCDSRRAETMRCTNWRCRKPCRQELDAGAGESREYLDGWQRCPGRVCQLQKAQSSATRRRCTRPSTGSIVKRYLDVVDDLERALKNRPQEGEGASWAERHRTDLPQAARPSWKAKASSACRARARCSTPTCTKRSPTKTATDYESGQIIEVVQEGYTDGRAGSAPGAGACGALIAVI